MGSTQLGGVLALLCAACATSGLRPLVLDGPELHASLAPKPLHAAHHGVPDGVCGNPWFSADAATVDSITRSASQGQLGGEGIRAALFAVYQGENEVGLYGLETGSTEQSDRLEGILRAIWAHNERLGRARVHRGGRVFVVVWNDGVSPACWQAVNRGVIERLADR